MDIDFVGLGWFCLGLVFGAAIASLAYWETREPLSSAPEWDGKD